MVKAPRFIRRLVPAFCFCLIATTAVDAAETTDNIHFTQAPEIWPAVGQPLPSQRKTDAPDPKLFSEGPEPAWIWGADEAKNYVVKTTFKGKGKWAWLRATCDNAMTVYVNGKKLASSSNFNNPEQFDINSRLTDGENVIEAEVVNSGGPAGFIAKLVIADENKKLRYVLTDDQWKVADARNSTEWSRARVVCKLMDHTGGKAMVTDLVIEEPRDLFNLLPGFQVERLFTVPKLDLGSWVCLTTDGKGRLIASDQGDKGLVRITPPPVGSQESTKVELLNIRFEDKLLSSAQGLLVAFDSLYVVVNGGPMPNGLYRCKDTNGDDQYDEVVRLTQFPGGGEHGPHALRLSPDGKSIYAIAGNHTKIPFERQLNAAPQTMGGIRPEQLRSTLPEGETSRLPSNWDEDLLLPRQWDAGGHAIGILAPGGWIAKTDPDGKTWDIVSTGFRNQYDFAFNADGEMFAYDADMEWDVGSPWYRPTRVVHATSGSEFGWRSGTGKWPAYYVDSLPSIIDIGPGSPVGVEFGYGTKFPSKYQKALFICDWTYGTMYAVHLEPEGSSYRGTKEEFLSRTPLPLTDVVVGADGALYFSTGGRGTQSELFRVTYVGKDSTAAGDVHDARNADQRANRRRIEAYHVANSQDPKKVVNEVFGDLASPDRYVRYAARVALERLPVELWKDRVLSSNDSETIITGVVGLARQGSPEIKTQLLASLAKIEPQRLSDNQRLELVRAVQLIFIRLGAPDEAVRQLINRKIESYFPTNQNSLDRELATLLVFLESPEATKKLIPLLKKDRVTEKADVAELVARNKQFGGSIESSLANAPDLQQYHYAFVLRNLKTGWTFNDRKAYFEWFEKAHSWAGGYSYQKFLTNIENESLEKIPDAERILLEASGARKPYKAPELPKPTGPGRDYTVDELIELSTSSLKGRDFKNGEQMYKAARCVVCHRFAGDGGSTGHDLTQVAGRFSFKDLVESIVDPSKVISDQYKTIIVETKSGKTYTGRIVNIASDSITLLIDPEDSTKLVTLKNQEIEEQHQSPISLMPKDLLKTLNENEVFDLLAYLLSRGNAKDPMFKK